jgi:hypothetical protein
MITPGRIKELLQRRPFRPFRLFLSDGSKHYVPHPEFAWVFGGRMFIGSPGKGTPYADGPLKELAILHVTRVEELDSSKPKSKK